MNQKPKKLDNGCFWVVAPVIALVVAVGYLVATLVIHLINP